MLNSRMVFFLILAILPCLVDAQAKKAREAKGTEVVVCSPEGKEEGSLTPREAMSKLKRGMELKLLSDSYLSEIVINEDRIIITGDPTRYLNASIAVNGKGCIVRGLWVREISASDEVVVVDSIVTRFSSRDKDRGKQSQTFYNSGFSYIRSSYRDTRFTMENCTVIGTTSYPSIYCPSHSSWVISDSIIYSPGFVFGFYTDGKAKARISVKDSLIYGVSGFGTNSRSYGTRSGETAVELKDLKKICSFTSTGKIVVELPKFTIEPPFRVMGAVVAMDLSSSYLTMLTPQHFLLSEDSPGKGMGIIFDEHPSFAAKTPPRPETPVPPPPPRKVDDPVQDDMLDRLDEEFKKSAEKPVQKKDEDLGEGDFDIGVAPDAPE